MYVLCTISPEHTYQLLRGHTSPLQFRKTTGASKEEAVSTTSMLYHLKSQHPTVVVQVESGTPLYGRKGHDAYKRGGR